MRKLLSFCVFFSLVFYAGLAGAAQKSEPASVTVSMTDEGIKTEIHLLKVIKHNVLKNNESGSAPEVTDGIVMIAELDSQTWNENTVQSSLDKLLLKELLLNRASLLVSLRAVDDPRILSQIRQYARDILQFEDQLTSLNKGTSGKRENISRPEPLVLLGKLVPKIFPLGADQSPGVVWVFYPDKRESMFPTLKSGK